MGDAVPYKPTEAELEQIMDSAIAENNLRDRVAEKLGHVHYEAGQRIKAGIHTLDDVYKYHARVKDMLLDGRSPNSAAPSGYVYSDLVSDIAELIISDVDAGLRKGKTYSRAVKRSLGLTGKTDEKDVEDFLHSFCSDIRTVLYGHSKDSKLPFPELLASLWDLRMLRPVTYTRSLDALKWVYLIASTINDFNSKNKIDERVDLKKILVAGAMNYGMLNPKIPLVEYSDGRLSEEEVARLKEHGQVGLVMLQHNGMPESEYLTSVVGSHNLPLDIISGIAAVGEGFEAMYFQRQYRKERLTPLEVFKRLGRNLFGEAHLRGILEDIRTGGYVHTKKLAKNPILQPYQMLGLVFGILEHLQQPKQ